VRAVDLLKPGGMLVYTVCSLQDDEGPARVEALLARDKRLQRIPVQPAELPGSATPSRRPATSAPCPRCGPSGAAWMGSTSRGCRRAAEPSCRSADSLMLFIFAGERATPVALKLLSHR
jgi:16S rRNA C967 or C1407 C5-methylase (RsmB/RsmF family)